MEDLKEKLPQMIEWMGINSESVTNIFNFGSYVHQTNSEKSDRDILIIADFEQSSRHFKFVGESQPPYFHRFKLWCFPRDIPAKALAQESCFAKQNIDITIYSCANFEKLLEANYMIAVECLFYPSEFQIKNQTDWREIYLTKYYNPERVKYALNCERQYSQKYLKKCRDDAKYLQEFQYLTLKRLFNVLKYFETGLQLLKFKSIKEFGRSAPIWLKIKDAYEHKMDLNDIYDQIIEPIEIQLVGEIEKY
jgi:hypothetical protein